MWNSLNNKLQTYFKWNIYFIMNILLKYMCFSFIEIIIINHGNSNDNNDNNIVYLTFPKHPSESRTLGRVSDESREW